MMLRSLPRATLYICGCRAANPREARAQAELDSAVGVVAYSAWIHLTVCAPPAVATASGGFSDNAERSIALKNHRVHLSEIIGQRLLADGLS